MSDFTLITTQEQLVKANEQWLTQDTLAIDLECENNLHHYGIKLCVIQISDYTTNWIIDVLAFDNLDIIKDLFTNKKITKVFHDVNFDIRMIDQTFAVRPTPMLDTSLAAQLLGKEKTGLSFLLEQYFNVQSSKKFQKADWTKRPMSKPMLTYACQDTEYLLELKDKLASELKQKDRHAWWIQECEHLEQLKLWYKPPKHTDLKGASTLDGRQLARLHELFALREKVAQELDKPVHYIVNNATLLDWAKKLDPSVIKRSKIHPQVKKHPEAWLEAAKRAEQLPEENFPSRPKLRRNRKEQVAVEHLNKKRMALAEQTGISAHLILDKEEIHQLANGKDVNILLPWQQKILSQ